jgi:hypothetical protein
LVSLDQVATASHLVKTGGGKFAGRRGAHKAINRVPSPILNSIRPRSGGFYVEHPNAHTIS